MPQALRSGFPTWWQTWGQGRKQALMLHCSLARTGVWQGIAGHLATCLTMTGFDLPGHGRSGDWNGEQDYHALCTAIGASFLDQPKHLIGHSFGATVALRLAIEQPQQVESLTLIEPVFFAAAKGSDAFEAHETEFESFGNALERDDKESAARVFAEVWGTGVKWERLSPEMQSYLVDRIELIPAAIPAIYEDNAGMLGPGCIESITCPTMLIAGGRSPAIIHTIHEKLARRIPHVTHAVISDAAHMAPVTHPGEVARCIRSFIAV